MTGEKNRYTTLEDKFKLNDTTLATPKHDEMIMWLLNEDNVCSILGNPHDDCEFKTHAYIPYDIELQQPIRRFSETVLSYFLTEHETSGSYPTIESLDLSKFVYSVDDITPAHHSTLSMIYEDLKVIEFTKPRIVIESEVPISTGRNFIVGYVDVRISLQTEYPKLQLLTTSTPSTDNLMWGTPICIEVKPTIKSFGETLRQLRTYGHYLDRMPILFTADTGFQKAFETQGIKVIPYLAE